MAIAALDSKHKVWHDGVVERWIYKGTTNLAAGASEESKIAVRDIQGRILEVAFESGSDNCDVWLSGKSSLAATSHLTYIYMKNINLGYSPELSAPRYYVNQDTTETAHLYLTVSNNASATLSTGTAWYLTITFERY